jgi:hypothetical protein
MKTADIETRLTNLEKAVARLRLHNSAPSPHPVQSLERIHGTFEDDEAFRQAMQLGRQWRLSQRPSPRKAKAKRR